MPPTPTSPPYVVLKFGGTSVARVDRWAVIRHQVAERLAEGLRPVVVVSAVAGVSDALDAALGALARGTIPNLTAIHGVHASLAEAMGLDPVEVLREERDELDRLSHGAALVRDVTPGLRARVMALGELMSTRLGAAWLRAQGLDVAWADARTLLRAVADPRASHERNILSAVCPDDVDPALPGRLPDAAAVLTQGFIAGMPDGGVALLGRGGSDTSAAYLAAALGAVRCEIWTDVPGMFTANPRQVPTARLLRHLDYDEAQEIASSGARVLHPRAIAPVRRHGIPLHIRSTLLPDVPGTVVTACPDPAPRIKAIASRRGICLVSMETARMWQQVGFLADAFARFKDHGLSVDLVSTSETNVTASLDQSANAELAQVLPRLLDDLRPVCRAEAIGPCASVTLVGRHVRAILHQIAPALEVFEERRVHLVSQAANDLNLTFVVDEADADRLVTRLHALLLERVEGDALLGPTSDELAAPATPGPPTPQPARRSWWERRREELLATADEAGTPLYVYDLDEVHAAARALLDQAGADRILYAIKANPHPDVLRRVAALGLSFECVSPGEIRRAFEAVPELAPERILFTPNFAPRDEYAAALARGVRVTLDNLHPLRAWPELFRGVDLFVRLDPGRGHGHHAHVRTAGDQSKFGIAQDEVDELRSLVGVAGARVTGLHAHTGSGIRASEVWSDVGGFLVRAAEGFPDVRVLDLGGGLGVPERRGQRPLDLVALGRALAQVRAAGPGLELWIEPGRYLVASAGVLLARVTQLKRKGAVRFVGVDAGMNSLIRPALYGAHHEIANLTRLLDPPADPVHVVGPICETGDTLGRERRLPETREGDVLLVATAGAYGRSMASSYNLRPPAEERVLPPRRGSRA